VIEKEIERDRKREGEREEREEERYLICVFTDELFQEGNLLSWTKDGLKWVRNTVFSVSTSLRFLFLFPFLSIAQYLSFPFPTSFRFLFLSLRYLTLSLLLASSCLLPSLLSSLSSFTFANFAENCSHKHFSCIAPTFASQNALAPPSSISAATL
jgi:hypothetical protein